jgi:hypothetical protein
MKAFILSFALCLFISISYAQEVLLNEEVEDVKENISEFGPNLKKFRYLYVGFGWWGTNSEGNGAEVEQFRKGNFEAGLRFKRKINEYYSIGWALYYSNWTYRLKQNDQKLVPNNVIHKSEQLSFNNLGLDIYNRFNFTKRGNVLGKFIDLGVFGTWAFNSRQVYTDELKDADNNYLAEEKEVKVTGLKYIENFNYGLRMRFGINRYVIFADYRLSDIFNSKFHNTEIDAELPRLNIGLQLGLHK